MFGVYGPIQEEWDGIKGNCGSRRVKTMSILDMVDATKFESQFKLGGLMLAYPDIFHQIVSHPDGCRRFSPCHQSSLHISCHFIRDLYTILPDIDTLYRWESSRIILDPINT